MVTERDILAIIPARGGSKGIPRKNIKLLCGKPLIAYTIEVALSSKNIQRVVVSTEDAEISRLSKEYGAEVIPRPVELAQDDTPSLPVFQQVIRHLAELESLRFDVIVILQPTSPLRSLQDVDGAIQKFVNANCDTVVSVCEVEEPVSWLYTLEGDRMRLLLESVGLVTMRQSAPRVYRLNGAVYVTRSDVIMNENRLLGADTRAISCLPKGLLT